MNGVIGRFAPSPTGPLHIGSIVAAVGSYSAAKRAGGLWLVRMEDLDTPRVVKGMADDILRTLEALGFAWDGEVISQSCRSEAYQAAFVSLKRDGKIYPCGCSRKEIAQSSSAPHDGDLEPIYPGICRDGLAAGKEPRAYRLRVGDEAIVFKDQVMGERCCNLSQEIGDFIIKRADGLFAYQLAVVVDDAEQGVNQVVRGADLLSSTPRQIHLQRLLNLPTPTYCHLPLVTGANGSKLSKRDNPVSLLKNADLKKTGSNHLIDSLKFLGQSPPADLIDSPPSEILSWAASNFDITAVPHSPSPLHPEGYSTPVENIPQQ